jgi:hypothetical protein
MVGGQYSRSHLSGGCPARLYVLCRDKGILILTRDRTDTPWIPGGGVYPPSGFARKRSRSNRRLYDLVPAGFAKHSPQLPLG